MTYEIIEIENALRLYVYKLDGSTVVFGWDYSDDYIVFRQALEIKGVKVFAELLDADANTAYSIFCNGL
jgi:hypothetical protein